MTTSPFRRAIEAYEKEAAWNLLMHSKDPAWARPPRTFEEDLILHHRHGFVFSTPDFFIMGRPVNRIAARAIILNPEQVFDRDYCDTWFVYLAAGNMDKAWSILPWPLPWLGFERKNELRFVETARIRRLSCGNEESPFVHPV